MANSRLNLSAIEACLRHVQHEFHRINERLDSYRDPMTDEVVGNMMAGYERVDTAIRSDTDLFALGNSRQLLELNDIVLCHTDRSYQCCSPERFATNEHHFYNDRQGGIRDLIEWQELHKSASLWERVAGTYIRILSAPQLYVEGNHRTGALIMSYLLVREGQPPFVLTVENAKGYFDPSSLIKKTHKRSVAMLFKIPGLRKHFSQFLQKQADDRFLLKGK